MNAELQVNARDFNELLVGRLQGDEGIKEAQELGSRVIRQRVWEDGFVRQILPRMTINRDTPGVQEDLNTDTLYYLVHAETLAHAISCNIRGNGDSELWHGRKYPVGLWKITTMRHHTDEATIRSLPYPYTKVVERQFPYLLQMIEDRTFILHAEAACWKIQEWDDPSGYAAGLSATTVNNGTTREISVVKGEMARNFGADSYQVTLINKNDIPYVARLFPGTAGESMEGKTVLFTSYDLHGVNTWTATEAGDEFAGAVTTGKFKVPTLAGYTWKSTNKTSILRPGNVYMFADQEYLGHFLEFMAPKMYIERYGSEYESWSEEIIGMAIGNMRGVKKLELFSASATPDHETDPVAVANVRPLSERRIVKENAVVDHMTAEGQPDGYIPRLY